MKIKKYGFFFFIFSLVGCSSVTMNNKREYKDTLSYKTSAFIADANCFQSLGIIKNGEYYEKNTGIMEFYYQSRCDLHNYFSDECKDEGGELIYDGNNHYWCIKNGSPLWGYQQGVVLEKYKSSNQVWLNYIREKGYKTKQERETEIALEGKNNDERLTFYNTLLAGTPERVLKADIGDAICKIDEVYSNLWQSPDERIYYFGNIEKKANKKILVRYSGHGNKNTYFDDVKGKIIWESPQGWMLCE